jgi:hypothetical protein
MTCHVAKPYETYCTKQKQKNQFKGFGKGAKDEKDKHDKSVTTNCVNAPMVTEANAKKLGISCQ